MSVQFEDIVAVVRKHGQLVTGAQIFDRGDFLDSDKAGVFAVLSAESKRSNSEIRRHKIEGYGAFLYGLREWGDQAPNGINGKPFGMNMAKPELVEVADKAVEGIEAIISRPPHPRTFEAGRQVSGPQEAETTGFVRQNPDVSAPKPSAYDGAIETLKCHRASLEVKIARIDKAVELLEELRE